MKNGPLFLLGLFLALLISWGTFVLGSHAQLGSLTPYYDENEGQYFPSRYPGLAARGQLVYADLGCASCHTQQVRRPSYGSDQKRGWGERQSVARDYIFQLRPQLGVSRFGPDLTNLAARKPAAPTEEALYAFLYNGSATHPSYRFLFDRREIVGEVDAKAQQVPGQPRLEIVPTERARTLVAYLLNVNTTYDYPEAKPIVHAMAAAPDDKKKESKQ